MDRALQEAPIPPANNPITINIQPSPRLSPAKIQVIALVIKRGISQNRGRYNSEAPKRIDQQNNTVELRVPRENGPVKQIIK